ncbi:hypothetical protein GCM10022247_56000 [Allokutzneria multivorans]|uniref:Transposase n=1 Tax=Allokutzneria multivorans TaxID=1142134 RepID=A0ABP7TCP5_9PSEU
MLDERGVRTPPVLVNENTLMALLAKVARDARRRGLPPVAWAVEPATPIL